MNELIYYFISSLIITKILIFYYSKNIKYKIVYIQSTKEFDKMIKKEVFMVKSYYIKTNKSIKSSRNYTTITVYNKNKINKLLYKKKCKVKSNFKEQHKEILIAIHCYHSLFYQRYVFRKIYRKYKNIQLLFFVGLDYNDTINHLVYEEMLLHKDIILFEFYNDYKNLHYLTFNFILWVKKYKYLYDVIVKEDTDTFLNIKLLQKILIEKIKNQTKYVLGYIWNINNKLTKYAIGMCYIFSSQSVNKLTENIENKFYKYVNGIAEDKLFGYLANEANFTFYDSYRTFKYKSLLQPPDNAIDLSEILMIHRLRIAEIAFLNLIIFNSTI